ncbi:MAG TPA: ABC transporter permease [Candidatus Nanoarchaeia archaeon]|nr:ABC transporter permease [Candidatus Nanoarchaeia archaeon]
MNTLIIKPKKTFSFVGDLKEIWEYRGLLYFLTWRDLKVRYKQTAVGVAWVIFQPVVTMVVFNVFFGKFLKTPSDGIPYPIFVYTGLLFWQFFSQSLSDVSGSLVNNKNIITKIYFPRLIIPISNVVTAFVDFLVASLVLAGLIIYYHYTPHLIGLVILPILVIITFLAILGLGLLFASVNVKYRDVKYVIPFFIQILMFVTPVIYPASLLGKYSKILALNPMTGVISTARATLLGTAPINWALVLASLIAALVFFAIGYVYFKKTEKYFADIV